MKVRIFNRGRGWYVSGSNYQDSEDKAFENQIANSQTDIKLLDCFVFKKIF